MSTPTSSAPTAAISLTGNNDIDALLGAQKWGGSTISYSIPSVSSVWSTSVSEGYGPVSDGREPWSGHLDFLKPAETVRFREALAAWAHVANIQFLETADSTGMVGDIRIAYSWMQDTSDSEAWAYLPDGASTGGDIWINTDSKSYHSTFSAGSYAYLTMLHELGHALGFKHPFETEASNSAVLDAAHDIVSYTLMSYFYTPGNANAFLSFYPTTPMVYDIRAIQAIYGKNLSFNAGDTVYTYNDSSTYFETIWDAGGNNTIVYTGSHAATIDLREGQGSRIGNEVAIMDVSGKRLGTVPNVWIAYGSAIRNAVGGSGDDTIILPGYGTVDGGAGRDTVVLPGVRSGYAINKTSTGITIGSVASPSFIDTLTNVERVKFSDTAMAFDVDGDGGAAYRIYQAAFDRKPDLAGLGYWIDKLDKGATLIDVAGGFFNSAEFKSLYGATPTNSELVTRLYQNVLHRPPEQAGYDYWMNELNSGHRSQATALAQFSESPENQAQLIGTIQNGMEFIVA